MSPNVTTLSSEMSSLFQPNVFRRPAGISTNMPQFSPPTMSQGSTNSSPTFQHFSPPATTPEPNVPPAMTFVRPYVRPGCHTPYNDMPPRGNVLKSKALNYRRKQGQSREDVDGCNWNRLNTFVWKEGCGTQVGCSEGEVGVYGVGRKGRWRYQVF
jgi:hypothetical protein